MKSKFIDNNLVNKYCFFSGDNNPCHQEQSLLDQKKRIIHGGLLCDTSISNNRNLKLKNMTRLKISFNNLLSVPSSINTILLKKEEDKYKFSINNLSNNVINYVTYFSEQKFPYPLNTKEFKNFDEIKIPNKWEENFSKNKVYKLGEYLIKDNFYKDSTLDAKYSSSLGILSKIVGMYIPGLNSTSALYDIYYSNRNDSHLYLKIINVIPSVSILRIVVQTKFFQAIINAKNKSPY